MYDSNRVLFTPEELEFTIPYRCPKCRGDTGGFASLAELKSHFECMHNVRPKKTPNRCNVFSEEWKDEIGMLNKRPVSPISLSLQVDRDILKEQVRYAKDNEIDNKQNRSENLRHFNEELSSLNDKLLKTREAKWIAEDSLVGTRDLLETLERSVEKQNNEQQETIETLRKELTSKEDMLARALDDIERLDEEKNALVKDNKDLLNGVKSSDERLKSLQDVIAEHEDALQAMLEDRRRVESQLMRQVDTKEREIKDFVAYLQKCATQEQVARGELETYVGDLIERVTKAESDAAIVAPIPDTRTRDSGGFSRGRKNEARQNKPVEHDPHVALVNRIKENNGILQSLQAEEVGIKPLLVGERFDKDPYSISRSLDELAGASTEMQDKNKLPYHDLVDKNKILPVHVLVDRWNSEPSLLDLSVPVSNRLHQQNPKKPLSPAKKYTQLAYDASNSDVVHPSRSTRVKGKEERVSGEENSGRHRSKSKHLPSSRTTSESEVSRKYERRSKKSTRKDKISNKTERVIKLGSVECLIPDGDTNVNWHLCLGNADWGHKKIRMGSQDFLIPSDDNEVSYKSSLPTGGKGSKKENIEKITMDSGDFLLHPPRDDTRRAEGKRKSQKKTRKRIPCEDSLHRPGKVNDPQKSTVSSCSESDAVCQRSEKKQSSALYGEDVIAAQSETESFKLSSDYSTMTANKGSGISDEGISEVDFVIDDDGILWDELVYKQTSNDRMHGLQSPVDRHDRKTPIEKSSNRFWYDKRPNQQHVQKLGAGKINNEAISPSNRDGASPLSNFFNTPLRSNSGERNTMDVSEQRNDVHKRHNSKKERNISRHDIENNKFDPNGNSQRERLKNVHLHHNDLGFASGKSNGNDMMVDKNGWVEKTVLNGDQQEEISRISLDGGDSSCNDNNYNNNHDDDTRDEGNDSDSDWSISSDDTWCVVSKDSGGNGVFRGDMGLGSKTIPQNNYSLNLEDMPASSRTSSPVYNNHTWKRTQNSVAAMSCSDEWSEGDSLAPTDFADDDTSFGSAMRDEAKRHRRALLEVFKFLDTKTLCHVASVCKEWRRVSRHRTLWTKVDFVDCQLSSEYLITIAKRCSSMTSLRLHGVKPRSRRRGESEDGYIEKVSGNLELGLEELLRVSQNSLRRLEIYDCGPVLSQRSVWLASCYSRALRFCMYVSGHDPVGGKALWALGTGCPDVTTLVLVPLSSSVKSHVERQCVTVVAKCFPSLVHLAIGGNGVDEQNLALLGESCRHLRTLELNHVLHIDSELATSVSLRGFRELQQLTLVHTDVTPEAILAFIDGCPHLRCLTVKTDLSDFTDPNTQERDVPRFFSKVNSYQRLRSNARIGSILRVISEDL